MERRQYEMCIAQIESAKNLDELKTSLVEIFGRIVELEN